MDKTKETLHIEGMSCQHCVRAVREALEATEGVDVDEVQVGSAVVQFDPSTTNLDRIREAIEEAGYTVR